MLVTGNASPWNLDPGPGLASQKSPDGDRKGGAFAEAAATIATGATAHHVVEGSRQKVRANARCLGR
jgi:hypothetical protein